MKILKAALLLLIILFAFSTANAQRQDNGLLCANGFGMTMTPIQGIFGEDCFEITVNSTFSRNLFIESNKCTFESTTQTNSFTTIICIGGDSACDIEYGDTVYCGIIGGDGNALCRDGCIVTVDVGDN